MWTPCAAADRWCAGADRTEAVPIHLIGLTHVSPAHGRHRDSTRRTSSASTASAAAIASASCPRPCRRRIAWASSRRRSCSACFFEPAPAPARPAPAPVLHGAPDAPPAAPTASSPATAGPHPPWCAAPLPPPSPPATAAVRRRTPPDTPLLRSSARARPPTVALHQSLVEDRQQPLQLVPPPARQPRDLDDVAAMMDALHQWMARRKLPPRAPLGHPRTHVDRTVGSWACVDAGRPDRRPACGKGDHDRALVGSWYRSVRLRRASSQPPPGGWSAETTSTSNDFRDGLPYSVHSS